MNFRNITNINQRQLDRVLTKEGQPVYDAYSGEEYQVLFRKSGSMSVSEEKVKIYYSQDIPIHKGEILRYKNAYYLVMNYNDIESEVFCSSTCVRCNAVWNIGGTELYVISSTLSSPNPIHASVASFVSGNISVQTSDIDFLHTSFNINDTVSAFGGIYKLVNKFFCDGIAFLAFERELLNSEFESSIIYTGATFFELGTYTVNPYVKYGNMYIADAQIVCTSSNEDIAICEGNRITFLENGEIAISMSTSGIIENGEEPIQYDENIIVNIKVGKSSSEFTAQITASSDQIKVGGSYKTLTMEVYNSDGSEVDISKYSNEDCIWTASIDGVDVTNSDLITWSPEQYGNKIKIKFGEDRSYLTKILVVKCHINSLAVESSINLEIISF